MSKNYYTLEVPEGGWIHADRPPWPLVQPPTLDLETSRQVDNFLYRLQRALWALSEKQTAFYFCTQQFQWATDEFNDETY